jgi:hypothetical protein
MKNAVFWDVNAVWLFYTLSLQLPPNAVQQNLLTNRVRTEPEKPPAYLESEPSLKTFHLRGEPRFEGAAIPLGECLP